MTHDRETFDVKGRLILFTYDTNWSQSTIQQFLEALGPTATKLEEAGAIAVLVLSSDVTLNSLNETHLKDLGLQRTKPFDPTGPMFQYDA